jgi:hypothetical protein
MADASLQIGNGNWAVKTSLLLGYNIVSNRYNPIEIGVTRETTGSRTNQAGIIDYKDNNIARINYEGGVGSLLLEPQRTNLVLQSEAFDTVSWTKIATTITADSIVSPSGIQNADTIIANGVSGFHYIYNSATVSSGITYSISVYAKKGTNNFIQLAGGTIVYGNNFYANFDLNNGLVGTVGSTATASIKSVGNGWYRCVITGNTISNIINDAFAVIGIVSSATSVRAEANILTTNIYLWGAQIEQGAYPTSYIPTTTTALTRNADTFTRNNIYTNGLITSAGGTWFVELNNNLNLIRDNGLGFFLDTSSSGITNGFIIRSNTALSSRLVVEVRQGGSIISTTDVLTNTVKIAIKWDGTLANVYVNGVIRLTNIPFTTTLMEFLNTNSSIGMPYYIKSTMLFPTPLTNTEMINLTTL